MIQSDKGGEFSSREFKQFLLKQNIDQKFDPPYQPKYQGAVENLNKTIQKLLEMAKYHKKDIHRNGVCVRVPLTLAVLFVRRKQYVRYP